MSVGLIGCLEEEKSFMEQGAEAGSVDSGGGQDLGLAEIAVGSDVLSTDETDTAIAPEVADVDVTGDVEIDSTEEETTPEVFPDVEPDTQDVALDATVVDADAGETAAEIDVEEDAEVAMEIAPDVSETTDVEAEIIEDVEVVDVPPDVQDAIQDVAADATEAAAQDIVAEIDAAEIDAFEVAFDADDVSEVDSAPETDTPDVVEVDIQAELPPPDPCLSLKCDDKNPCTADSCDKVAGCSNVPMAGPCDDADSCTEGDVCGDGKCLPGKPKSCNDGNPCTSDSCDPKVGCSYVKNSLPCEDGDICTEGEKCSGGACTAGSAKNCSDGNVCTSDSCEAGKGCVNKSMAGECSDGNICTEKDSCVGGTCLSGALMTCDDNNPCTSNVCTVGKGCVNDPNWVVYDWKEAPLAPTHWKLGGNMLVTCDFVYEFKGNDCALIVPKGTPAASTSFAELDLDKVRLSYKMGTGDLMISYWWGRYQFDNGDSMTSLLIDGTGKVTASASHSGPTGTFGFQEFIVSPAVAFLRFQEVLIEKPLVSGPAAWDKVRVELVACKNKKP